MVPVICKLQEVEWSPVCVTFFEWLITQMVSEVRCKLVKYYTHSIWCLVSSDWCVQLTISQIPAQFWILTPFGCQ